MNKLAIAAVALLVAACGSKQSGTVDTDQGKLDYSVDKSNGDTSVTLSSKEGDVKYNSGATVKADLPEGFTLYPGATVINTTTASHAEGSGTQVFMSTKDSKDKAIAFYRKQAEAAGIDIKDDVKSGPMETLSGTSKDGENFMVSATEGPDATAIRLLLAKGFDS